MRLLFLFLCLHLSAGASSDQCPSKLVWYSDATTYVFADTFHPSVVVPAQPGWQTIDGASWIWVTSSQTVGTFTFIKSFPLIDRVKNNIERVAVKVACDDYFGLRINGHTVEDKAGYWSDPAKEYDLTSYVRYSSPSPPQNRTINRLEIIASNTGGPGAVNFKIEVTFKANSTVTKRG